MGWSDLIEGVLGVAPRKLVTWTLLALLGFMAITGNVGPILWWIGEYARAFIETWQPVLIDAATPG